MLDESRRHDFAYRPPETRGDLSGRPIRIKECAAADRGPPLRTTIARVTLIGAVAELVLCW